MRVIRANDVDWAPPNPNSHRGGHINFKFLLTGQEGARENYKLSLTRSEGGFASPRHRHNFDQVRIPLEGRMSVQPGEWLQPEEVGFFPEGTYYGPQEDTEPFLAAVLQAGGASGNGYMSRRQSRLAQDALATFGRFEGGVFHREQGEGRRRQDGYEAVWEHANGRPLVYPKSRYDRPIRMTHTSFAWRPTAEAGVWHKLLGVFTERETRLEMLKLEPGARYATSAGDALEVAFIYEGSGRCGEQPYDPHTAIECPRGEEALYHCEHETTVLRMVMPMLD